MVANRAGCGSAYCCGCACRYSARLSSHPEPSNTITDTVAADLRGVRLDDFLLRRWPDADRARLRRWIREGGVRVNFEAVDPTRRLKVGDYIECDVPEGGVPERARDPQALGSKPRILAESDWFLAIDKPSGLASVPDRAGKDLGVHGLLPELREEEELRIAHRLDRETSGCLVLARSLEAARWIDACFREGRVRKQYLALVEGAVARDVIEIRRALGPDRRRPGYVTVVADGTKKSRSASTDAFVVERFRDHTLVRLHPHTGRGHQLRAHLRSIGHPIVGDVKYGATGPLLLSQVKRGYKGRPGVVETPLLARTFLHSASIEVPLPDEGQSFEAHAPLPADLERALQKLRRFAATDRGSACN